MQLESRRELEGTRSVMPSATKHVTWRTVFTGEGMSAVEIMALLSALGVEASDAAKRLIEYVCHGALVEMNRTDLAQKTLAELGGKRPTEFRDVEALITSQNLAYCPQDTALSMRQEYSSLPLGERVIVVSKPIQIAGLPCLFSILRNPREIRLDAVPAMQGDELRPHDRLILVKPAPVMRAD